MTTVQREARALGDPTRHAVFRYLVDAGRAVDVAELTAHFGLNHNAIRQHLAKLLAAGLVVEEKAPTGGRGRPRLCYLVAPNAESRWGAIGPYERLSLLLTEIIRTGDEPVEVGRRAGRRLAGERADEGGSADPVTLVVEQMARQGFDPTVSEREGSVDVVLRACPFATTAIADPDTVCGLHLGMAYGIADTVEGLVIDELVRKDPRHAHCRLRCHVDASPSAGRGRQPVAIEQKAPVKDGGREHASRAG
jgi:predicted ArsR family transcriptional regulator